MKIYGPYLRKDGRKHVIIIHDNGISQTRSYPRLLLEQKLGRSLTDEETVDHIDGDFTNDAPENLRALSRVENAANGWITGNCSAFVATKEFRDKQRLLHSGSKNGMAKLTDKQILDIRSRPKYHGIIRDLMLEFNLSRRTIQNILNHTSYLL
jgi:hypothetical protein